MIPETDSFSRALSLWIWASVKAYKRSIELKLVPPLKWLNKHLAKVFDWLGVTRCRTEHFNCKVTLGKVSYFSWSGLVIV